MEVPVKVKLHSGEVQTTTEDLSSHGLQFCIDAEQERFLPETVELRVTLPSEVTLSVPQEIWCQARVMRKVRSDIKRIAVSAKIEHYFRAAAGHA